MPTQIYMPLRSNAAWFTTSDARAALERQIKTNLLLYDHLILQDGRFHLTAGKDGQGMNFMMPRSSIPENQNKISYYTPTSPFGVAVGDRTVMTSTCETAYEIDFLPIIQEAGLWDASFVRWSDREVHPQHESLIRKQVSNDLTRHEYLNILPSNTYLRRYLMDGIYRDSMVASSLKTPISVDFQVGSIVSKYQRIAMQRWSREIPAAFFDFWINLNLPDLSNLSWHELREFHESEAGESFRRMVDNISTKIKTALPEIKDQRELDHLISREFNVELLSELSRRVKGPGKTVASIFCNFIPGGFIPAIGMEANTLAADLNSWVSLTKRYNC